jgi:hypothetical protein
MQEITAWLQNKDFEQGRVLYMKYGTNSYFKTLLESGPTPFNVKKLGAELKGLAPVSPASTTTRVSTNEIEPSSTRRKVPENNTSTSIPSPPANKPVPAPAKLMERYLGLKELLKTKYRQLERNMIALDFSEKEEFLLATSKQIISLNDSIGDIHDLIDYFDEHGDFPLIEVQEDLIRTVDQEVQLLRQSNSKAKRRIANGKCRDVKKTNELIELNNKRIAELLGKDDACL